LFSSPIAARAQFDPAGSHADALSAAAKASPKLVKELAKELGSTPEQAAGAAGVIFGVAKSLLKQEDFAKIAKAVPGMDALLAAAPTTDAVETFNQPAGPTASSFTPGFTSSSSTSPSTPGTAMAAVPSGMASAMGGLSKLGIKPETLLKAVPFLSGYLKKLGGADVGGLLGGVFKQGK
jgi:hypothetical protein